MAGHIAARFAARDDPKFKNSEEEFLCSEG